ncbi:COBW domain-containing protein [Seminavis robusta]|uniref:COBW domain-containing protein n=1 Tax=Seminavis robusta TaxID=568900 RepID=A0A9N8HMR1_9STRA|nr:COBW domain-containing protein [Seminavis robusta]|eukprot:Sro1142_g245790.1 COBW domain-containing protein (490) ;mRNA; r:13198-14750
MENPSDSDDDDEAPLLVALDDDEAPLLVAVDEDDDQKVDPTVEAQPLLLQDQPAVLPPCPVTILSGFLGSGKTTLIQYILKSPVHKKRIAVIENEFGEGLAIETLIAKDGVDNSSLADFIELPNGCVCCTVKDSLVETLENLLEKRQDLDYIIIEASGMANPGPIASVFWLDEELDSRLRLDGVVTLVDAYHITKQLQETEEASQQVAYADRILLNKIDLIQQQQTTSVDQLHATLQRINPTAPIRNTTFSQVPDLEWILDANCYDEHNNKQQQPDNNSDGKLHQQIEKLVSEMAEGEHSHSHDHGDHTVDDCATCQKQLEEQHSHTSAVSTLAFKEQGTMSLERLNAWMASVLWPNQDEKDEVLRARLEQQLQEEQQQSTATPDATQKQSNGNNNNDNQQQQIFRIKGVVSVRCQKDKMEEQEFQSFCDGKTGIDKRRYIVQAVYDIWDIHASTEDFSAEEDRECKLVVIGRHLQRHDLQTGFQSCLI